MIMTVTKLIVTVVGTDTNPASVAASVDAALSSLSRDKHRIYFTSADNVGNEPTQHEIPDQPFLEPDNDKEMRADDDWMNNHVIPLSAS